MDVSLYETEYKKKKHFSFGKNWQSFLKTLNEERIKEAKKSLTEFLGRIKGKTFIDVGCGSGLFSLAAHQLGARVVSVDVDDYSLQCAQYLKDKYGDKNWTIRKGSALDEEFIKSLGKYDIAYSWGVLHHTGSMWKAIKTVSQLAKPKGLFYTAIYNNNTKYKLEGTSKLWKTVKKIYNNTNFLFKKIMYFTYLSYLLLGIT
ncbi:MAG TPA: class I SAM-dependent methyltransferase, partial [Candidatus Nanoarchaeia archaeon]|nr:class I SAM-dependent methyltransferase [Candidatus Nanoarchaeia archaeon]